MWIVIPTLKKYETAYRKLWNSIPPELYPQTITVFQDESYNKWEKTSSGYKVYIKKNIYEYGGWVGTCMLIDEREIPETDFFLMIHDTCEFGPNTVYRMMSLEKELKNTQIEFFSLLHGRFHNLCIVTKRGLTLIGKKFESIESMTKPEALSYETTLGKDVPSAEYMFGPMHQGPSKVYSDLERMVVYVHSLDMFKFYIDSVKSKHPDIP